MMGQLRKGQKNNNAYMKAIENVKYRELLEKSKQKDSYKIDNRKLHNNSGLVKGAHITKKNKKR